MTAPVAKETIVRVADWAAGRGEQALVTLGLGSCVAIMLHDPQVGAGGMAHILLPSRSLARDSSNQPHIRMPVKPSIGASTRHGFANTRSP